MSKTYSQTYLYKEYSEYDKKLLEFIMNAERIDTKSEAFADIVYDVKRRKVSDSLVKILQSNKVILGTLPATNGLSKAFKVFVAKDLKTDKQHRVFIDVTGCINTANGGYECQHIEWLISYLMNAMVSFIYATSSTENKILGNSSINKDGGEAFVKCFSYILDRIYKISTVRDLRLKIEYAIALYWQMNIMEKASVKSMDTIRANAIAMTSIDVRHAYVVDGLLPMDAFVNISTFSTGLANAFNLTGLKPSIIVDKWIQAFGTGTVFGLEFFPAFSAMLTDAYVGGYINNQLTIEKVTGTSMVSFAKDIISMGASVV